MKILDNNSINYILKNRLTLRDDYYITPDIQEEADIIESIIGRKLSAKVRSVSSISSFNEVQYLAFYKDMLNKYPGRSFYNMTGFGDISILALIKTIEYTMTNQSQACLFDIKEGIEVFTEDRPLTKKIQNESSITLVKDNSRII